ncbi:MAG: hypothetical protein MUF23_19105 [Pirellula sp.]|jgi:hypothetical protein|nr:hypothetical protein [Pirellula sp.]
MKVFNILVLVAIAVSTLGCQSKETSPPVAQGNQAVSAYLANNEPAGAIPVGEARDMSNDGKQITLVGRIGGSSKPFVDGLAAFTIVDLKVPYCAEEEECPTPWDYCCQTDAVKRNIATVKIVDEGGKPVAKSARDLLKVNELSTVVVQGTAKRDEQGNLTIAANQVFVRPGE